MYLSYEEYLDYGGTLDETTYNSFNFEAEALINYYTFNRLTKDTVFDEKIKRLVYRLIEIAQMKQQAMSLGVSNIPGEERPVYITRQSNDGVDTTYSGMSAANVFNLCKNETKDAVNHYLFAVMNEAGQKVLYRGLYPGE